VSTETVKHASQIEKQYRRRRLATALATALAIATASAGLASAQSEDESGLVWRRLVVPGLSRVADLDGVATDGTVVAAVSTRPGKTGTQAQVWSSPDGRTNWSVVTPPATAEGPVEIVHGADGWAVEGLEPGWMSTDGLTWSEGGSIVAGPEEPLAIGGQAFMVEDGGMARAVAGTDEWAVVDELDGIDALAPMAEGGIGVGAGVVVTSPDGEAWERQPEGLLEGADIAALASLDDGAVVAVGTAPGFGGSRQPALWIAEPADRAGFATVEESAAKFTSVIDGYNAKLAKIDRRIARTFAQVHDIAKAYQLAADRVSRDLGAWPWPPEASADVAAMVALLEETSDIRGQQRRVKNDKALGKTVRQLDGQGPSYIRASVAVREALGIPVSKALRQAFRKLERQSG